MIPSPAPRRWAARSPPGRRAAQARRAGTGRQEPADPLCRRRPGRRARRRRLRRLLQRRANAATAAAACWSSSSIAAGGPAGVVDAVAPRAGRRPAGPATRWSARSPATSSSPPSSATSPRVAGRGRAAPRRRPAASPASAASTSRRSSPDVTPGHVDRPRGDLRAGPVGAHLRHPRRGRSTSRTPRLYGLSAGIWTSDINSALTRRPRASAPGTVWVNRWMDGYPELPFGGYGASGDRA